MSKFRKDAKLDKTKKLYTKSVINFMCGQSFGLNPLTCLQVIAASSIFGEPSYYRSSKTSNKTYNTKVKPYNTKGSVIGELFTNKTTDEVFVSAIDTALSFDFKGTLDLAVKLRSEFLMRFNPAVILVRAMLHEDRVKFNESNPGYMQEIVDKISFRPDDITNQFEYWMHLKGDKSGMPSVMKRAWAKVLSKTSRYQLSKYKSKSLIDLIRISHANSEDINELMKTGNLVIKESENTWERLRSEGKKWVEILNTIEMPHMALLRNLRGIFSEEITSTDANKVLDLLKKGVAKGKQFPYRYYSAYREIGKVTINFKEYVLNCLEECIDLAVNNMPKLEGKTAFLSDNSASAWGAITSEYGSVTVAEIANLSCMLQIKNCGIGSEIFVFGDRLSKFDKNLRNGVLSQIKNINSLGKAQGEGTENGIWIFLNNAIKNKIVYDNIFVYSDMQAGQGGFYGLNSNEYKDYIYNNTGRHIDVLKLVEEYRKKVNPKVNMFLVQVAGYDNSILPENYYRTSLIGSWTGKETIFANEMNKIWDKVDNK